MDIKSCGYNYDTGAIKIIYANGTALNVLCDLIEDALDLTLAMKSKYDWLIFNEPTTFVELFLTGELLPYLEWYDKVYKEQEKTIRKQLEAHYSPETLRESPRVYDVRQLINAKDKELPIWWFFFY